MRSKLAAIGTATALALGGLGVAAANPLAVAGAQDPDEAPAEAPAAERQGPLERALDALVADGTLTAEQADAVREATRAEAEAGRAERQERRQARVAEHLEAVAEVLGTTPEAVREALVDGTSLAEQAEAAGVDRQAVADVLAAGMNDRIDAAEADGTIDADQAARAREHVDEAVERILDAAPGEGRWGRRGFGNRFRPGD
ncbi:MAG: hypothetical protein KDA97_07570 [Acidimicrobiales bacterium]|nr:hypothetical protein [Acidimicrobiales bacterium]